MAQGAAMHHTHWIERFLQTMRQNLMTQKDRDQVMAEITLFYMLRPASEWTALLAGNKHWRFSTMPEVSVNAET